MIDRLVEIAETVVGDADGSANRGFGERFVTKATFDSTGGSIQRGPYSQIWFSILSQKDLPIRIGLSQQVILNELQHREHRRGFLAGASTLHLGFFSLSRFRGESQRLLVTLKGSRRFSFLGLDPAPSRADGAADQSEHQRANGEHGSTVATGELSQSIRR